MIKEASGPHALQVLSSLLRAEKIDTVYRDLYLQRARTFLAPLLSYPEYLRLEQDKVSIDNLLRQNRAAVERGEWGKVKELSGRIRALRQMVEEQRSLLELGQAIYDATDVPLDLFSPGFPSLFGVSGEDLVEARERIVAHLSALEKADPAWRALLQHGPQIVQKELHLDPHEFRLLCIPFDLYSRLGPARGWGRQPFWTHFDGYQLLEGGKLR